MKGFWRACLRKPTALTALSILLLLYGTMIFSGFVSPYTPATVFRNMAHHPPNIRLYSKTLGFGLQVQHHVLVNEVSRKYAAVQGRYERVRLFVKGPVYSFWGLFNTQIHLFGVPHTFGVNKTIPAVNAVPVYLMGADDLGRDIFTRILYGGRISLTIGFVGTSISLCIAIILGGISGYAGGKIDWLIMRCTELVILIPGLYLILFLRSLLSRELDSGQSFMLITVILSFVGWTGPARLIRGLVHSCKREDFITNARLESIPALIIIVRHIIPHTASILIVLVTLSIPGFILGETVLSYLGLGIVDPAVSWGSLLNRNTTTLSNLRSFPWLLYPGLFLFLTSIAFRFFGDFLRDFLDPYSQGQRVIT